MFWDSDDRIYRPFFASQKELDGVYERAVKAFDAACAEIEKQEDEAKVRRIVSDIWGLDMISEPSSLSEGRR